MEFCNLAGANIPEEVVRRSGQENRYSLKIPAEAREASYSVVSNVVVTTEGESIVVREATDGENPENLSTNLFAMTEDPKKEVMPFYKRKNDPILLWADVQDTPENPAIIVMCKAIHLVNDVKTYMKVLNVSDDCIIAMLIAGAAGFEVDDGEILTMTRCCPENISVNMRKTKKVTPKDLNNLLSLTDANGYKYNMDMVISMYMYFGSDMVSVKTLRESCIIFDHNAEGRAKAVADAIAARNARREEARKKKEAEDAAARARQEEMLRQKKQEEAEKAELEKKNHPSKRGSYTRHKVEEIGSVNSQGRNTGAEFFLNMLKQS